MGRRLVTLMSANTHSRGQHLLDKTESNQSLCFFLFGREFGQGDVVHDWMGKDSARMKEQFCILGKN